MGGRSQLLGIYHDPWKGVVVVVVSLNFVFEMKISVFPLPHLVESMLFLAYLPLKMNI